MVVREKIQIVLDFINNMTAPVRAVNNNLQQLERQTQAYQRVATDANITLGQSKKFFKENSLVMTNSNTAMNSLTGQTRTLGQVTDGAKRSATRFNFSWLSVMFAGMALNRVFGGLIKSQLKLFGITDLFSSLLTIIMLPIMTLLLPLFFQLFEIFSNLSEEVKLSLGVFIFLGAIFGIILLIVGQVMLAMMGLASVFGIAGIAAIAVLFGIVVIFVALGLIITGIILIVQNWGKDTKKVVIGIILILGGLALAIIGIGLLFFGLPILAAIAFAAIIAAVIGLTILVLNNWDKIRDGHIILWARIKNVAISAWNFLVGLVERNVNSMIKILNLIPGIDISPVNLDLFKGQLQDISDLGVKLANQRWEKEQERIAKARDNEAGFVDKFKENAKNKVGEIIPSVFQPGGGVGLEGEEGQTFNLSQTNNINVSNKEEMEKLIRENNVSLVEEIKRQVAV